MCPFSPFASRHILFNLVIKIYLKSVIFILVVFSLIYSVFFSAQEFNSRESITGKISESVTTFESGQTFTFPRGPFDAQHEISSATTHVSPRLL